MAKRTGLGRGIGALIPTAEQSESRPVDVFFPDGQAQAAADQAAVARAEDEAAMIDATIWQSEMPSIIVPVDQM